MIYGYSRVIAYIIITHDYPWMISNGIMIEFSIRFYDEGLNPWLLSDDHIWLLYIGNMDFMCDHVCVCGCVFVSVCMRLPRVDSRTNMLECIHNFFA